MNTMRCEQCGRFVDDKPCPFCQSTRVRELRPGEKPSDPLEKPKAETVFETPPKQSVTSSPRPPKPPEPERESKPEQPPHPVAPPSPRPDREPAPEPEPRRRERPRAVPSPEPEAPPAKASEIRSLAEFEALLTVEKFKAIIICGLGMSGKSEISNGFTRANSAFRHRSVISTTRARSGTAYALGGTGTGNIWFEIINTARKLVFLDPAGEFFQAISPTERQRLRLPDVTPEHFQFVRGAVKRLAGVVLVVDLTRTLDDMAEAPWRNQEIDLEYTLAALRWLRHDKEASVEQLGVTSLIASRLPNLPRLDVPVLVLFSKADKLGETTNELPLPFARRKLPTLFGSIRTHARRYRFDFASTMLEVNGIDRQAPRPCGVLLPMEWLINDPFRWMPSLPTRFLEGGL